MTTAHATTSRSERALRLFEEHGHEIQRIGEDLYRVPSCIGAGSYTVRYGGDVESCTCPDFEFGRGERSCKHLLCVGIAHAKKRFTTVRTISVAGDPFAAAGRCYCYGGVVYVGVEEDGEEHHEAVPCRRCSSDVR